MIPPEDEVGFKPAARSSLLLVIIPAALWIGLGVLLSLFVPIFAAIFSDFGVDLPVMTVLVIQASWFVTRFYWIILPVLIILAGVDRAILERLRRGPGGRRAVWIWSGLMMALPVGVFAFMFLAIFVPLIQLITKLSG